MISEESKALFVFPVKVFSALYITPIVYDAKLDQLQLSTGFRSVAFKIYAYLNIVGQVGLIGLHIINAYNGYMDVKEVLLALNFLPMYALSFAVFLTMLSDAEDFKNIVNRVYKMEENLKAHFNIPDNVKDGSENFIKSMGLVIIIIILMVTPAAGAFLQRFEGFFHNVRFESFEGNLVLGSIAAISVGGDLSLLYAFAAGFFFVLYSTAQWLDLMLWQPSTSAEYLQFYKTMYRAFQINYRDILRLGYLILPVFHVSGYLLIFNALFCIIYLNFRLSVFILIQFSLVSICLLVVFEIMGKLICDYTSKSQLFGESYLKHALRSNERTRGRGRKKSDVAVIEPVGGIGATEPAEGRVWTAVATSAKNSVTELKTSERNQDEDDIEEIRVDDENSKNHDCIYFVHERNEGQRASVISWPENPAFLAIATANQSFPPSASPPALTPALTLTLEDVRFLKTCRPFCITVANVFTYDRLTFVKYIEFFVLQNVINALLTFR